MALRTAAPPRSARATSPPFTFAVRAGGRGRPAKGSIELHFTYDEEFGGLWAPAIAGAGADEARPDDRRRLLLRSVTTAHNGCPVKWKSPCTARWPIAVPHTGVDALQAAVAIMNALYAENTRYLQVTSRVPGIKHPYLNIGRIEGGTNTNVIPGKGAQLDRRMILEETAEVEAGIRAVIAQAAWSGSTPSAATRAATPCA